MSQGWSKIFNRINWLNRPSTNTPLNATNLNAGDSAIDKLDDRIITLDTVKADMQVVNGMVSDVSLNESNGVITITYKNGSTKTYDTNIEKIAVNFSYDKETQRLVLVLPDGTEQYVDLSAFITDYEFADSDTIAFSVDSSGKVSASIKNGSITEAMLETGYLANIKVEVAKAEAAVTQAQSSEASSDYNSKLSRSYAIGGSGIRDGEDTDNAMYYCEQAQKTDASQIRKDLDNLTAESTIVKKSVGKFINDKGTLDGKAKLVNLPHNMLNPTLETTTQYGVTCTNNGDGTYTLNGTSTSDGFNIFILTDFFHADKDTHVRFVCMPEGAGITSKFWCSIQSNYTRPNINEFGSGATSVIYPNQTDGSIETYAAKIIVAKDVTLDNVVVKPMLINLDEHPECADITYDDFVPYESYEVKSCGKNLLNPTLNTTTSNGVTCTKNGDGTYTLNGTATLQTLFGVEQKVKYKPGTYRLVGCPIGGSNTTYGLIMSPSNGTNYYDYGSGVIRMTTLEDIIFVGIVIYSGQTVNNITFKPMLTTDLDATYDDYEPYQESSVTVTQDTTEAWLDTYEGETNILAPLSVTAMYGTNMQGNEIMKELYGNKTDIEQSKTITKDYVGYRSSIIANSKDLMTVDVSVDGYTPIGVIGLHPLNNVDCSVAWFFVEDNLLKIMVKNETSTSVSDAQVSARVLYTKEDII